MQLTKLEINGYKNLNGLIIDFQDKDCISVIIGNNGSGKSNIIEAISFIFAVLYKQNVKKFKPTFVYSIEYTISDKKIKINFDGSINVYYVNETKLTKKDFYLKSEEYLPSQVIASYSGEESRLWSRFYEPFYN